MLAKLKVLGVNLALAAVALIVAMLLFEAALRITGPWVRVPIDGLHQPDSELHHVLTPSFETTILNAEYVYTVRTNSMGLRDREIGPKGANEFRILALGDSFVFGSGADMEHTFLRLIENTLNGERHVAGTDGGGSGRRYQVINTGAEGSGTDRQVMYLRMHGAALQPDLVLAGFYVGNDFSDNVQGQVLPYKGRHAGTFDLGEDTFLRRLHSYIFLRERTYILLARLGMKKPYLSDFDMIASLARGSEGGREKMDRSLELLEMIAEDARQLGVPHAVYIIPARAQVYPELAPFIANFYDLEPDDAMLTAPDRLLMEGLAERGIPSMDLLPGLRNAAAGPPLYFKRDIHWTRRGHDVVARMLVEFLLEENLLGRGRVESEKMTNREAATAPR